MGSIDSIKSFLYSVYPNKVWKMRVDHMSDSQLIAVWSRLRNRKKKESPIDISKKEEFAQLPLFKEE